VPIENISAGVEVLTADGYAKVAETFHQGVQKTIKIKTQDGWFECTENHKMAVLRAANEYDWVPARSLKPGDRLVTSRTPIEGSKTALPAWSYVRSKHSTTCRDIVIPELDADMAWFIGLFQADGYTYANRKDNGFNAYISVVRNVPLLRLPALGLRPW
jgi:intein/homing endonuclease